MNVTREIDFMGPTPAPAPPATIGVQDALQVVLATRAGGKRDEWDDLVEESGEVVPTAAIEKIVLGEGHFSHRDEEGKKKIYAQEITGIVLVYTSPRVDFLGGNNESLPPFCSSADGVWGRVDLPDDDDIAMELIELAEDEETPHPLITLRESSQEALTQWQGKCAECPRSRWGSANGASRGQACKAMRRLLVLPDDGNNPIVVQLPATSTKIWDDFAAARSNREDRAYYFCRVKIGSRIETSGSYSWGKVTLENLGRIDLGEEGDTMAMARAIVNLQKAVKTELLAMSAQGVDYTG